MGDINITVSEITDIFNDFIGQTMDSQKTTLTAGEAANLWTQYMGDSEALCIYSYLLKIVEDKEIQPILEHSLQLSQKHLTKIEEFFNQANYPIPIGFNVENDVNLNAPRLFSDEFALYFAEIMTIHGLTSYSLAICTSEREEIRNHFIGCAATATELYNKVISVSKSKGQFSESPTIPSPDKVQFVEKTGIISDLFGDTKPLSVVEINNLFFNMKKTILAKTSSLAFSQVAESADVRKLFSQHAERAEENLRNLASLLHEDDLPTPPSWDDHITNSTISPFSDKLMMFHVGFKMSSALAYYGTGMATSMRADVIATYSKLISKVMKGANDWLTLMVKNEWMEQSPAAVDRKSLAQRQK